MRKNGFVTALFITLALSFILVGCAAPVVQRGDSVLVTYTGRYQNGTIFDTNDPKMRAEFFAQDGHFIYLPVTVGKHQVVTGFENALIGMKEGETKSVVVKASDAYGGYDPSKALNIPKVIVVKDYVMILRIVETPRDDLAQKISNITVGRIIKTTNFEYNITSVNATTVTLYALGALSDPINLEKTPWNSSLALTTPTNFTYTHNIVENASYGLQTGPYVAHRDGSKFVFTSLFKVGGQYPTANGLVRITGETNESYALDLNHPLAGEPLNFTITIGSIEQKK